MAMDHLARSAPARIFVFRPNKNSGLVSAVTLMPLLAVAINSRRSVPLLVSTACWAAPLLLSMLASWYCVSSRFRWRNAQMAMVAAASWAVAWLHLDSLAPAHLRGLLVSLAVVGLSWWALLNSLPLSFTAGEAWLVIQGAMVAVMTVTDQLLVHFRLELPYWPGLFLRHATVHNRWNLTTRIVAASVWGLFVAVLAGWLASLLPGLKSHGGRPDTRWEAYRKTAGVLGIVLLTCVAIVLPATSIYIGQDVLTWFVEHLAHDGQVFAYGVAVAGGQVAVVTLLRRRSSRSSDGFIWRKAFHVVVLSVFFPMLILAPDLITTTSAFALVVFGLAEMVRILQLQPICYFLEDLTGMFRDARDSGPVLMTPIYLLLGCAGPIWVTFALVSPNRSVRGLALPAFAGLLSLGVGDAAAAYIGSRYGRTRFPGSSKTVEGWIAGAASQLVVAAVLVKMGYVGLGASSWVHVGAALTLGSLYEALTHQIDNLVLPLYTLAALLACP